MAENDTSLNALGPVTAQLKTNLSALEKTQINSIKNLGGGLSANAGVINGDVSGALSRINATQRFLSKNQKINYWVKKILIIWARFILLISKKMLQHL